MSRKLHADENKAPSEQEKHATTGQESSCERSAKKRPTMTFSYFDRQGFREMSGDFSGDGT